jgi:hypothetical protein
LGGAPVAAALQKTTEPSALLVVGKYLVDVAPTVENPDDFSSVVVDTIENNVRVRNNRPKTGPRPPNG